MQTTSAAVSESGREPYSFIRLWTVMCFVRAFRKSDRLPTNSDARLVKDLCSLNLMDMHTALAHRMTLSYYALLNGMTSTVPTLFSPSR